LLDSIPVVTPAATPSIPAVLDGKILFLTAYRGNPRQPNAMMMNPDGTEIALLTTNFFYSQAAARDELSADKRYRVYSLHEAGGEAHNAGLVQIFYDDYFYNSTQHQLTYFGAGVAWAPTWSPTDERVAFVSSESGNDEIWVGQRGQWPAIQLTKNEWAWDHHPSFSPDGSQIVFSSNRVTGRRQLWIMSSSGEDQRQLTNFTFEAWDPVWVKYVEGE
jgi:Tol biopolymer transport system component